MKKRDYFLIFILLILSGCAEKQIACTEDARLCSDGSSVARIPPDCEFAECPETTTETLPKAPVDQAEPPIEEPIEEPGTPSKQPLDPNLIAHLKFDGNGDDSAGMTRNAIIGDADFSAGKIGDAIYLGGNGYVDFSTNTVNEIGALSEGTIAFWFKFSSLLDKQTIMPIFYIGNKDRDPDNLFIIEIGHFDEQSYDAVAVPDPDNKKIYVTWIKDNKDPFLCYDSNVNLEENKWYHFAVVVSENGNTGYLDGVEMTNRQYNFGNSKDSSFLDDIPGEERFMLGYGRSAREVWPDFVYFKGALDDFRVYDRPLSADEIKELS